MTHTEFVEDIRRIKTGVVADLAGKDLQSFGEGHVDKLKFPRNREGVFADVSG